MTVGEQPVLTILGSGGLPPPRTRLGFGRRCSPARTRDLAAELVPWSQSDTRRLAGAARSELALLLAPGTLFGDPLIVLGPSSTHTPPLVRQRWAGPRRSPLRARPPGRAHACSCSTQEPQAVGVREVSVPRRRTLIRPRPPSRSAQSPRSRLDVYSIAWAGRMSWAGRMYRSIRVDKRLCRVWAAIRSSATRATAALVACPARSEWAVMRSAARPAARARFAEHDRDGLAGDRVAGNRSVRRLVNSRPGSVPRWRSQVSSAAIGSVEACCQWTTATT